MVLIVLLTSHRRLILAFLDTALRTNRDGSPDRRKWDQCHPNHPSGNIGKSRETRHRRHSSTTWPAVFLLFLVLVTGFEGITLTIRGSTDSTKRFRRASGKTVPLAECSSWTASIQKNRFARILVIVVGRTSISTEP